MSYPYIKIDAILLLIGEFAGDSDYGDDLTTVALRFTRMRTPSVNFPNGSGAFTPHIRLQIREYKEIDGVITYVPSKKEQQIRRIGARHNTPQWQIEREIELTWSVLGPFHWSPTRCRVTEQLETCRELRRALLRPDCVRYRSFNVETSSYKMDEEDKSGLIELLTKIEMKYTDNVLNYLLVSW